MSSTGDTAPVPTREPDSPLNAALAAVNDLAIELAALPPDQSVQHVLSERLRELSGAVLVAFSDFDAAASTLTTSVVSAPQGIMDGINGALGKRMIGHVYHVGEAERAAMLREVVIDPGTLTDITFGQVPPILAGTVQRIFGVDRFLSLNYSVRGELYGTSMLALGMRTPDPAPELLEAVVSVGAVSLCRRQAETALHAANRTLEKRIAERTSALEGANTDLSEANRHLAALNADLERTVDLLDDATRAKSEFLARMSHELRTPLNSIIGFSGTMLGGLAGDLTEEQTRQLQMISKSGTHLLGLINEILDVQRIEAGRTELVASEVSPSAIAAKALFSLEPLAAAKGLSLRLECGEAVPSIVSDHQRIEQVLLNLLGNAVKFTDSGEIVLRCASDDGGVRFEVSDTGIGIAPELQRRVFEEFYRAPLDDGSVREGSGLGLSLTYRLTEKLQGRLSLSSEVGEGSTFTLWLPSRLA